MNEGTVHQIVDLPVVVDDRLPVVRTDLATDGAFLLHNLLSVKECRYYVELSEDLGYDDISHLYHIQHRQNDRVMVHYPALTALISERIRPFLPATVDQRPFVGCNELLRFCRYYPGGHFEPHYDGSYEARDIQSLFTVNIYLNGGFGGGDTNMLSGTLRDYVTTRYKTIVDRVVPEPGMALIFPHARLHEGARLESGVKYIVRTDAVYRR
jgi:hypothetical protein